MDDLPLTQEADHIVHIGVIGQTKDVVIGKPGLLLCRHVLSQIGDHVASDLHRGGGPWITGGKLGIYPSGVIDEIGVKAGGADLVIVQIAGQLVDKSTHHFQMPQLLGAYQGAKMCQQKVERFQYI